jgi:hypothetical protein
MLYTGPLRNTRLAGKEGSFIHCLLSQVAVLLNEFLLPPRHVQGHPTLSTPADPQGVVHARDRSLRI